MFFLGDRRTVRQADSEGSRRILFLNFSLGTHQGKKVAWFTSQGVFEKHIYIIVNKQSFHEAFVLKLCLLVQSEPVESIKTWGRKTSSF